MGRLSDYAKKWSAAGTSAGVIAAGLVATTSGAVHADNDDAAAPGPVMVSVQLPAQVRGSGTAYASLLPSSRVSRAGQQLGNWNLPGTVYTMQGDDLAIELDPARVPARYVDAGGLVTVQVDYVDAGTNRAGSAMRTVRAISADGTPGWIDPDADLPSLQQDPASRLPDVASSEVAEAARLPSSRSTQALTAAVTPTLRLDVETVPGRVRPISGYQLGARTLARDPIGGVPRCNYKNQWKKKWGTIGTSYPLKGSQSWLTYTSSSSSSFGVAVSMYGGAFKSSDTRTLGDDWGQDFAERNINRSFRVQVKYRKQVCRYSDGSLISRRWIPQWETGGTWGYKLDSAPSHFKKCAPIAGGPWYRGSTRGRDYSLSFGVKFKSDIGVDLSTRRAYSNGARLYYANDNRRRVCGNDDDPSRASKVRERKL